MDFAGRLTLTMGTAVTIADVADASNVYYTACGGGAILVWNGISFVLIPFSSDLINNTSDNSVNPNACIPNSIYNLFVWNKAGVLTLSRGSAWSSNANLDLALINGINVNANSIVNGPVAGCGTYVGTILTDGNSHLNMKYGSNAIGGGSAILGVWNAYNQVKVNAKVQDSKPNWNYLGTSWHLADDSQSNRITFVCGRPLDGFNAFYQCRVNLVNSSGLPQVNIGFALDSISIPSCVCIHAANLTGIPGNPLSIGGFDSVEGQHFIQALEVSDGNNHQFVGNGNQSLNLSIMM